MPQTFHSILLIAVIALATAALRFLPFLIFSDKNKTPKTVVYLSTMLPCAMIGMLIVYCFRNISVTSFPFGLPEIISAAAVAASYLWKRNTLLSVGLGTVCYIILIRIF